MAQLGYNVTPHLINPGCSSCRRAHSSLTVALFMEGNALDTSGLHIVLFGFGAGPPDSTPWERSSTIRSCGGFYCALSRSRGGLETLELVAPILPLSPPCYV